MLSRVITKNIDGVFETQCSSILLCQEKTATFSLAYPCQTLL